MSAGDIVSYFAGSELRMSAVLTEGTMGPSVWALRFCSTWEVIASQVEQNLKAHTLGPIVPAVLTEGTMGPSVWALRFCSTWEAITSDSIVSPVGSGASLTTTALGRVVGSTY